MFNDNDQINISVTFRHTESTPALKSYAIEKVSHCLKKYIPFSADAQVILAVEKGDHIAEAKVHSKGHDCFGRAVTGDLYSAIDKVIDTIDSQLRKQKEKQADRKRHPSEF